MIQCYSHAIKFTIKGRNKYPELVNIDRKFIPVAKRGYILRSSQQYQVCGQ